MKIDINTSIKDIPAEDWNQLSDASFPFSDWHYLFALESTDCIGERTGWHPFYLTVMKKKDMVGAAYLYVKTNSYGEYIFDWSWADAARRADIEYFPKLTSAVPFTPATGPKLLFLPGEDQQEIQQLLIHAAMKLMLELKCSSLHWLFNTEDEIPAFQKEGFIIRHSVQFHWHNRNYQNFEDFLQALKRKKRREIKRERKQVQDAGIELKILTGDELTLKHAELMHGFYLNTIQQNWAMDYLTREFYDYVFENMKENIVLATAQKDGKIIAAALNYTKGKNMFGRYWGSSGFVRQLHFELCYYSTIEYAIANKIERFEAGAQGGHKIQRGFSPAAVYSAHTFRDARLGKAITEFVENERQHVEQSIAGGDMAFAYKPISECEDDQNTGVINL